MSEELRQHRNNCETTTNYPGINWHGYYTKQTPVKMLYMHWWNYSAVATAVLNCRIMQLPNRNPLISTEATTMRLGL